ncbi:MAG: hypothetical protein ACREX0_15225 [Noviherbaspirillum sp.]
MNERKAYVAFLIDGAAEELGGAFNLFIRNKDDDAYFYAKSIDAEGNYFQLVVDQEILPGTAIELELQIPHEFVKGVFCGEYRDIHELGYF